MDNTQDMMFCLNTKLYISVKTNLFHKSRSENDCYVTTIKLLCHRSMITKQTASTDEDCAMQIKALGENNGVFLMLLFDETTIFKVKTELNKICSCSQRRERDLGHITAQRFELAHLVIG